VQAEILLVHEQLDVQAIEAPVDVQSTYLRSSPCPYAR